MPLSPLARSIRDRIRSCTRCDLRPLCRAPVPWSGSVPLPPPRVLVIGEAPGEQEDEAGRPFVGRAGQLLRKMLRDAGLPEGKFGYTNQVRCRPTWNKDPTARQIAACRPHLELELKILRPDYLLLVGRYALQSIRPKAQLKHAAGRPIYLGGEGKANPHGGRIGFPVYHPAALLHPTPDRNALEDRMRADLIYFWSLLYNPAFEWPEYCEACDEEVDYYDQMGIAYCRRHYPKMRVDQGMLF